MASRGFGIALSALAVIMVGGGVYWYQLQSVGAMQDNLAKVESIQAAAKEAAVYGPDEDAADNAAIKEFLDGRDFASLESYVNDLRENDRRTTSGLSRLKICYGALDGLFEDMEQHKGIAAVRKELSDWKKEAPESQTLRIASGRFFITAAWNARGGGYANTVREEQWKVFNDLLEEAYETLSIAVKSEPYDPQAAVCMLTLGMAAGMPKNTAMELIDECIQKYPTYENAYQGMCVYLLPRWAGNPGDVKEFMKYVKTKLPAPLGDIMVARMAYRVYDYTGQKLFEETGLTYEELKPSLDVLMAEYPAGLANKRMYSKIVAMGDDLQLAQNLYEETSATWSAARIKSTWGNEAAFGDFTNWVTGKGDNPVFVTPLETAIKNNDYAGVQAAIADGADVNRKMSTGSRPLISAISDGHSKIADLLLEHGADLSLKTRSGYTVAAATADSDNVEMLQKLLDNGFKITDPVNVTGWKIQHMAAYHNAPKCLELVLKQPGANVDEPMGDGGTALFLAAEKNSTECAKILLDAKANVNAKDNRQITALHHAAVTGAVETMQLLLDHGADATAASESNVTVLETAERNHQKKAADLLRQAVKK